MKTLNFSNLLLIVAIIGIADSVSAQEVDQDRKLLPQANLNYRAPSPSAPKSRVGSVSRGLPDRSIKVSVLTPEQSGLTTQELPSLYWYLSQPTSIPIELTVIEDQAVEPILETRINRPNQPGVQQIRLADYGVRLKPGIEYRWFVAVVPDPENRSKDIVSGGIIERIEAPANLRSRVATSTAEQIASVYADEGIWYDALAAISARIDNAPSDPTLRVQRAALLKQVQLPDVAAFDTQSVR